MKLVSGKTGLILRLGVLVTAMLVGQQAMAVGTRAATAVDNTATVDYEVSGVAQTQLSATADFVVDRRVDFTLVETGAALVPITPGGPPVGDPDYFVEFLLTNTSNSVLDFNLALSQLTTGTGVRASSDSVDLPAVDLAVAADPVGGASPTPARGVGNTWVDELEADAAILIRVYGDTALTLLNDQVAGVDLTANGAEPGAVGVEGAALNDTDPPSDLGVENVFDNPNVATTPNFESAQDGFIVVSTELAVTKIFTVIAGDLGSGQPIPGATVEYDIALTNSSAITPATVVSISDLISPNVTLVADAYGAGADVQLVDGGGTTTCSADASDGDGDGCGIFAPGSTLIVDGNGALGVAVSDTLTVSFQVLIPDPAVTP